MDKFNEEAVFMTKIDVISGFLGAGKTTLISKLLKEALGGEQVVLIENEFGEIGIDGGFLKDAGIEIREMSQGCICCSLVGDFEKALREVIERFSPERVIIEPSGVGKLSDVMKAVTDASANLDVVLNSAVTVVDAKKCRMYMKNFGEFFNNQVQYAGTIVLSRTDIVGQDVIDADVEMIRSLNPAAEIVTTPVAELGGARLLEIIEKRDDMLEQMRLEALSEPDGESEEEHEHHHHHHDEDEEDEEDEEHEHHHHHHHHHHGHDADEIFESFGWTNVPPISRDKLETALQTLANDEHAVILRSKGMLKAADADAWYYFDMVPGEYEIREGAPDYTGKVCVIGSELREDDLKKLFF
jgi:G3E family GTPase